MSAIKQAFVAIMYIGFRQFWEDTIYGTGLTFEKGQVRNVPPSIAMRLLRHSDAFREHKQHDGIGETSEPDTGQQDRDEQDDTQELLEQAEKQEQEHKDDANRNYEALQMIDNLSTKAAVAEFAETHYQAKINQRLSLDNMRAELRALVEKFGVR